MSDKLLHLQGLRGLAILFVVLFHFFPAKFGNGYVGVDMFFMLSGYLMTMMLERKKELTLLGAGEFLYRRGKRIVPLYYLVILIVLSLVQFASVSIQKTNVESSFTAILFATNLIRPNGHDGYFAKLGVAVDLFTHTWSLALEMQFYFLFPLIFYIFKKLSQQFGLHFIVLLCVLSGAFYLNTDQFMSFNSVFARIWQFLAGLLVYYVYSKESFVTPSKEPIMCLEEEEKFLPKDDNLIPNSFPLVSVCLLSLCVLIVSPQKAALDFARMNTVLMTSVLLLYGKGSSFLENKYLVYIGEVSYAWYLLHWPIAATLKLNEKCTQELFLGVLVSLIFAILLHECFEKFYLKWERPTVLGLITILLLGNIGMLVSIKASLPPGQLGELKSSEQSEFNGKMSKFNYPTDFIVSMTYGYENKTNFERIELNNYYQSTDLKRSLTDFCPKFKKTSNPSESRCELNEGANKTANSSLLVVGNSYAGNLFKIVHEECKNQFSHMEISFTGGCESLTRSNSNQYYNCSHDFMFLDAIREIQPDYLFIVEKHFQLGEVKNGQNPFDDDFFNFTMKRMEETEKLVKKKIYILDAFPAVVWGTIRAMNNKLKSGVKINDAERAVIDTHYLIMKMRLQRIVDNCLKCRLFDYASQFFFDGQFKIYDPKYFVSFFTEGSHLTPAGWERVRPLIKQICDRL